MLCNEEARLTMQCLFKTFLLKLEEEISQKRYICCTVQLGDKERLNSEQPGKSEPFVFVIYN